MFVLWVFASGLWVVLVVGLLLLFVLVFDSLFILVVYVCCFVVIAGVAGCWGGGLLVDCLRCWLCDFVCYLILVVQLLVCCDCLGLLVYCAGCFCVGVE